MFKRILHLLGFKQKKDDALEKRFAKIRRMYEGESADSSISVVTAMRTGYNLRTVVGAEKTSSEVLRKNLLESYARTLEMAEKK